jgi:hypothetical protein
MNDEYAFVTDLYDSVLPYRNRPDVSFIVGMAQESGGPVLEIACRTGPVLIPTARAGLETVALICHRSGTKVVVIAVNAGVVWYLVAQLTGEAREKAV